MRCVLAVFDDVFAEDLQNLTRMTSALAVTGATGRLGGRIAQRLATRGVPQVLLVRDPSRAPALAETTVVKAAFSEFNIVARALRGVSTVLMVSASESPHRVDDHKTFVDAAVAADVQTIVYTSFVGAAPDATFTLARDHWTTEQYIRSSGLSFTFLRDNLYADFLAHMAGSDGEIRGPAADGRVAAVAQDDIADAAVAVLCDPRTHAGRTYDLTGPQALTLEDVAVTISAALGRAFAYVPEALGEAYRSRAKYGAPRWQLDAWVSTYVAIANGELSTVTNDIETLAGHPPTSLGALLQRSG